MRDSMFFGEIWASLKQHKVRNILTGFGVAWGIFILIILVGAGEGLQGGINDTFSGFAQKSVWVYGGQRSIVTPGQSEGALVEFETDKLEALKSRFPQIEALSPEVSYAGQVLVYHDNNHAHFTIKGIWPDYFKVRIQKAQSGRLLNARDQKEHRKVAVIGSQVYKLLFDEKEAIGKYIELDGHHLQVVGVLEEGSAMSQSEQTVVYMPLNTYSEVFGGGTKTGIFAMTLSGETNSSAFSIPFINHLSRHHDFDHEDQKAVAFYDFEAQVSSFNQLFDGFNVFLWIIGMCLLLSGMVGIGNIMLVIVRERTREIGVRKALGATPNSIVFMILGESITITLIAGLVGLFFAWIAVLFLNLVIASFSAEEAFIVKEITISAPMAFGALGILVFSGCLAGLFPARQAANVMPAEALRYDES